MTEGKDMLASVSMKHGKVINNLMNSYSIPDPLPWTQIAWPLVAFRHRFQFAALSGKSASCFQVGISAGIRQRFDSTRDHRGIFPKSYAKPRRGTRREDFVVAGRFRGHRVARRNRR